MSYALHGHKFDKRQKQGWSIRGENRDGELCGRDVHTTEANVKKQVKELEANGLTKVGYAPNRRWTS